MKPLLPGAVLGVIGGGQLGRYFVLEARRLGYETWVLDPDATAPAMQLCSHPLVAAYDDPAALSALGEACDAVTTEFENVPAESLRRLSALARIAPAAAHVEIAQDRATEKRVAAENGLAPVPHAVVERAGDLPTAIETTGLPAILKTTMLGYDGKGQRICTTADELDEAWHSLGGVRCVLERRVDLAAEVSVVLARGFDGVSAVFPVAGNVHVNGILETSTVPSGVAPAVEVLARERAVALADGLDYHGILAIEFFVDGSGELWFNEMAPRPHNSGHYTLDATSVSQFEQQLRVLCGLPLGDTTLSSPVCMVNLLGDLWSGSEPPWMDVFAHPGAALHLYGKAVARPGRKMGHVNCLATSAESALADATSLHATLVGGGC